MADTKVLPTGGGVLYRAGKLINGVSGIGIQGAAAQEIDTTTLISGKRAYILDVADPGTMAFVMNWNPSDDVHKEMYDSLGSESLAAFEWRAQGKIVNDVNTKQGKELAGELNFSVIAVASGVAKATVDESATTSVLPNSGDYLKGVGGAANLIVKELDYSTEGSIKYTVVKAADGTAASASGSATKYTVVTPAMTAKFQGFVQALPLPNQGRGTVLQAQVQIRITGDMTWTIGNPDID